MSKGQWDSLDGLRKDLLEADYRTGKPRTSGATIILDTGLGVRAIDDLCEVAGSFCDYAKLAWGNALITQNVEDKVERYRAHDVTPLIGGTLFEYAYMRGKAERLVDFLAESQLAIEISDGCIDLPRRDKLAWIEKLASKTTVLSELGGKLEQQSLDWPQAAREELHAGSTHVVIEGREVGPVGEEIRVDLVDHLVETMGTDSLFFEALERKQQVFFVKHLGPNVNLGNIRPWELLTLESFRQGLKEHTLLHTFEKQKGQSR